MRIFEVRLLYYLQFFLHVPLSLLQQSPTGAFSVLFRPCVESGPDVATNIVAKARVPRCRTSRFWPSGVRVSEKLPKAIEPLPSPLPRHHQDRGRQRRDTFTTSTGRNRESGFSDATNARVGDAFQTPSRVECLDGPASDLLLTHLVEHELLLVLLEELRRPRLVQEQGVDALHVLYGNLRALR